MLRQIAAHAERPLCAGPDGELAVLPLGHRGARLERRMRDVRNAVARVERPGGQPEKGRGYVADGNGVTPPGRPVVVPSVFRCLWRGRSHWSQRANLDEGAFQSALNTAAVARRTARWSVRQRRRKSPSSRSTGTPESTVQAPKVVHRYEGGPIPPCRPNDATMERTRARVISGVKSMGAGHERYAR